VGGTGDTGNDSFTISGDQLLTDAVFDLETKGTYSIRVRSTDSGTPAEYLEEVFEITIKGLEHHCLSVEPLFIYKNQNSGLTTTMDISITNTCSETLNFEIFEGPKLLWSEGFESGEIPPDNNWDVFSSGTTENEWMVMDIPQVVYEGQYAAWVGYDNNFESNEWLRTPIFDISTLNNPYLSFMALTTTTKPSATMEVWVLDEAGNPLTAKPIWDLIDDEKWDTVEYHPVYLDLSPFTSYEEIRIDWRYVGQGGQSFALDKIEVGGAKDFSWLSSDPINDSISQSSTKIVNLTFDSTSLATGNYNGSIFVNDSSYDLIRVSINMFISSDDYSIYFPLLNR
jgi:hypothetical protein